VESLGEHHAKEIKYLKEEHTRLVKYMKADHDNQLGDIRSEIQVWVLCIHSIRGVTNIFINQTGFSQRLHWKTHMNNSSQYCAPTMEWPHKSLRLSIKTS
jgi:hypothetical protein